MTAERRPFRSASSSASRRRAPPSCSARQSLWNACGRGGVLGRRSISCLANGVLTRHWLGLTSRVGIHRPQMLRSNSISNGNTSNNGNSNKSSSSSEVKTICRRAVSKGFLWVGFCVYVLAEQNTIMSLYYYFLCVWFWFRLNSVLFNCFFLILGGRCRIAWLLCHMRC